MRPVEKVPVICWNCGSEFFVYPSRKNAKSCSFECRSISPTRRFLSTSWTVKPSGCWEWNGSRYPKGYGYVTFKNRNYVVSRVSWEYHYGPIPDGLCALHHCDNPPCVNPKHLFLGTKAENNFDMFEKGRNRHLVGEAHQNSILTEVQVKDVLAASIGPETDRVLAQKYGVHFNTISLIRRRRSWRHV